MVWESGKVSCWGENDKGQLGDGEFGRDLYSSVPVEVSGITDAVDVSAGWEHTCAVHATGEVSCWGDDTNGELGNGAISNQEPLPVKAEGIADAIAVTVGHLHTCALRSTGEIACWGAQPRRATGQRRNGQRWTPILLCLRRCWTSQTLWPFRLEASILAQSMPQAKCPAGATTSAASSAPARTATNLILLCL